MKSSTILRGALAAGLIALAFLVVSRAGADARDERVIQIAAQRFHYTPDLITLKKGEAVTLEFTALDFTHGFKVPELGVRADLTPGRPVLVHLLPEKTGRFLFLCDNFCGSGHEEMNGVIVVTD